MDIFWIVIRLPVLLRLPLLVGLPFDGELDGVVTSSHGSAVPLELLDGTALVHEADGGGEEEGDQDGSCDGKRHLVVLLLLGLCTLDARVLDEQGRFGTLA